MRHRQEYFLFPSCFKMFIATIYDGYITYINHPLCEFFPFKTSILLLKPGRKKTKPMKPNTINTRNIPPWIWTHPVLACIHRLQHNMRITTSSREARLAWKSYMIVSEVFAYHPSHTLFTLFLDWTSMYLINLLKGLNGTSKVLGRSDCYKMNVFIPLHKTAPKKGVKSCP